MLAVAAAEESGEAALYRTRLPDFSSLRRPNPAYHHSDWWDEVEVRRIPARTLDDIAAGDSARPMDLLKVDVQGTELEVLRGGEKRVLPAVHAVVVETRFVEQYVGQARFSELESYLRGQGFTLFGLEPGYLGGVRADELKPWPPTRRRISHADALFFRAEDELDGDPAAVGRQCLLYLLHGFFDDALRLGREAGLDLRPVVRSVLPRLSSWRWRRQLLGLTLRAMRSGGPRVREDIARAALEVREPGKIGFGLSLRKLP